VVEPAGSQSQVWNEAAWGVNNSSKRAWGRYPRGRRVVEGGSAPLAGARETSPRAGERGRGKAMEQETPSTPLQTGSGSDRRARVLLIKSRSNDPNWRKLSHPLGLMYVASYLRSRGGQPDRIVPGRAYGWLQHPWRSR